MYVHPVTGERVPSVTNCIDSINKPAIPRWAAKSAAEYAAKAWDLLAPLGVEERVALIKGAPWRESEKAANLGTAVHDAIDHWCRDEPMPGWAPGVEPFMEQFALFLAEMTPTFLHNESTVWNRTEGYAGTLDFIAIIGGLVTLGDTKSGKNVYPEVALQLTALAHGEFILTDDGDELPMPKVEAFAALHVRPRSWSLIPVEPTEASWQAFLAAKRLRDWSVDVAPNVLGAKVRVAS
jgi:hypothetical protein